uniref:ZP domain-containing protein n=1 Tax=Ciona savignyi TaxID=51511 RepID=H2YWN6_CIOSA
MTTKDVNCGQQNGVFYFNQSLKECSESTESTGNQTTVKYTMRLLGSRVGFPSATGTLRLSCIYNLSVLVTSGKQQQFIQII